MPNRYRHPLKLLEFRTMTLPGPYIRRWVGTELVADLPDGRILVRFNLIGLGAN